MSHTILIISWFYILNLVPTIISSCSSIELKSPIINHNRILALIVCSPYTIVNWNCLLYIPTNSCIYCSVSATFLKLIFLEFQITHNLPLTFVFAFVHNSQSGKLLLIINFSLSCLTLCSHITIKITLFLLTKSISHYVSSPGWNT